MYFASTFGSDHEYRALVAEPTLADWRDCRAAAISAAAHNWGGLFDDESTPVHAGINGFKRDFGGAQQQSFDSTLATSLRGRILSSTADAWRRLTTRMRLSHEDRRDRPRICRAVSAVCLARDGHEVIGVDKDPVKLQLMHLGQAPVVEEGLPESCRARSKSKRLNARRQDRPARRGVRITLSASEPGRFRVISISRRSNAFAEATGRGAAR